MYRENPENHYFRVKYKKLETSIRLSSDLRCDMKFEVDKDNNYVFALYPFFENVTAVRVNEYCEALNEGTAIICKPVYPDKNGYFDMIRARVKVGAKAYFAAGPILFSELTIVELVNEI